MASRNPSTVLSFAAVALALACTGATCSSATHPDVEVDAGPPAPPPLRTVDGGMHDVGSDAPLPTADDLPGFPLDEVLPSLARQMLAFANDAFSYDGCATPLAQCLKQPGHHRHALRMLALATRLAAAGANNVEIDTALNRYYASFAPSERAPSVTLDDGMCRGPRDARVTVVEFSDFECPYCRMARPLLEGLVTEGGQVRLCFKPFPLGIHAHSEVAAEAALYAKAQGKFWEMHDLLFEHQDALEVADLQRYASDADVDPHRLAEALEARAFAGPVEASKSEGKELKVKSTPTVFLNGRHDDLPLSTENLVQAVDDEIEWQANGGRWAPQ